MVGMLEIQLVYVAMMDAPPKSSVHIHIIDVELSNPSLDLPRFL